MPKIITEYFAYGAGRSAAFCNRKKSIPRGQGCPRLTIKEDDYDHQPQSVRYVRGTVPWSCRQTAHRGNGKAFFRFADQPRRR